MGNLLYIVAVVFIILWAIGYFAYSAGSIIHVLLVIAAIVKTINKVYPNERHNETFFIINFFSANGRKETV